MLFTKHSGVTVDFGEAELVQALARLDAGNTRFCAARDDVVFVNTGGGSLVDGWLLAHFQEVVGDVYRGGQQDIPLSALIHAELCLLYTDTGAIWSRICEIARH